MTAHKRRGIERWQLQGKINAAWKPNDVREYLRIQDWAFHERRHVLWSRNKKQRELIGPPEFNGPLYTGQTFVGKIECGRIVNCRTILEYACIRGMHDACFAEYVARCRAAIAKMKMCAGPALP